MRKLGEAVKHTASVLRPGESGRLRASPVLINEIDTDDEQRYHTGLKELDRVLGGGIVKGSLVLLGEILASESPPYCFRSARNWGNH